MADEARTRLIRRREQLLKEIDELWRLVEQSDHTVAELHEGRINQAESALDRIDAALAQSNLTQALEAETAAREAAKAEQENATFWFRRFMLSLQIGNGAGFLATAAVVGQVDAEAISLAAVLAWAPATYFGLGTATAGLLPLIMAGHAWAKDRPKARYAANLGALMMTTFAIGFFACGITSVVVELRQLGQPAVAHAIERAPIAPNPTPAPTASEPSTGPRT
ncbi:hypothetical protein [Phenylobacterium sp.]|uniref:hypothetical protein n=1 Tax=Phenylobacterium sp. TaxID=1871053 RepID=UPI00272F028A|nr:hypothetical protein [Phenylobacterium sp.]MDP2213630.1 hypothetical protein [Phenylobacterium sp.]